MPQVHQGLVNGVLTIASKFRYFSMDIGSALAIIALMFYQRNVIEFVGCYNVSNPVAGMFD